MSASLTDLLQTLLAWRRQRLPHGLFVAAALTLALASAVGQDVSGWTMVRIPAAWALVAVLRLWDDLEDCDADRDAHPKRVRLDGRVAPVIALIVGSLALGFPLLLALCAALLLFYRLRPSPLEAVLLLKYPALVLLLRGAIDGVGLGAMLLVYGGMLLDSDVHLPGWVAVWAASLALAWLVAVPAGMLVLAVGLALPWVKPVRPGVLMGIVLQLLAFQLGTL